jgi:membrane fusion protein (multidrug efflux system)
MKDKIKKLQDRLGKPGFILLTVLVAVILLTMLLKALPMPEKELPKLPEKQVPVEVVKAVAADLPDQIVLPGLLLADVDATLAAEKSGRVVELLADRGQTVTNGQVLLQLDDRIARIAFEDSSRTLKRFEKLSTTGAVSQQQLDDIRKAHDLAATELSYCTVKSPANGIVNERYVEEGEYVVPATPLFDVVSINPVRVSADIPERNISELNEGDRVEFEVLSLPNKKFSGTVSYISAKANTDNNAFRIELTVPNKDNLLRPGMIASVLYRRGTLENAIALPLEAVIPQKGDHVVYVVRDGIATRQLVRIQTILGQDAVISSGVEAGDQIVVRGNRMLSDGTAVTIQD